MAKQKKQRKTRPIKSKKARVQKKQVKRTQDLRRQELVNAGLSPAIIARGDLTNKQLSKAAVKDWRTRGQKLDELNKRGYKNVTISDLRLSWPRLKEKYPEISIPADYKSRGTSGNKKKPNPKTKAPVNSSIKWTGQYYIYIGAAEVQEGFRRENLGSLSDQELIERINDRIADAMGNPSGSSDLFCIYQVYVGTKEYCEEIADFYYERGYNISGLSKAKKHIKYVKLVQERYNKLTISNEFSQRDFHEMVYNVTTQMKNEDVAPFINQCDDFCIMNGFPFMEGILK